MLISAHAIDRISKRNIPPSDVIHAIEHGRRFIQHTDYKIRHTAVTPTSGLICVLTSPDAKTIITVFKIKRKPPIRAHSNWRGRGRIQEGVGDV